ncbi:MAG: ABC1 kinase family protein [bacterium]
MPLTKIGQTYKNIQRLRHIVNVLIKHGFGQIIEQLHLQDFLSMGMRVVTFRPPIGKPKTRVSVHVRVRHVFEELGPTFIKFGQLLSMRPDIMPKEFINEFKKLQDNLPPLPFPIIKKVIEEELECPSCDIFADIREIPTGSASIAEVHEATLKDGTSVMIKVQRPKIEQQIDTDINILFYIAHLLEKYMPESRFYDPVGLIEQFSKSIHQELDFTLEASNTQKFNTLFEGDSTVVIPKVYWDLTSKRVLILQKISGVRINDLEEIDARGWDRKLLARNGCHIFLKQFLEFGLFHGDPHPGNLFVVDDGVLGLMDFGIVGRLNEEVMESCAQIFFAYMTKDYDRLIEEYLNLGFVTDNIDLRAFKRDFIDLTEIYYDRPLKHISVSEIFSKTLEMAMKHNMRVPVDLMLLGKTILFTEEVGRQLDPDLNLIEVSRPYAKRLIKQRLQPKRIIGDLVKNISNISKIMKLLPNQINTLTKKLIKGELKIEFEHLGLDNLIREIDRSSNRIAFGLIISSIIVGSSIIMSLETGPLIYGYPLLGVLGYVSAGIMGLGLVISILRSGKF